MAQADCVVHDLDMRNMVSCNESLLDTYDSGGVTVYELPDY